MPVYIEKKLRVTYSAPVAECVRRLRVLPPQTLSESWRCRPEPDSAREFFDEFGNRVLELRHERIEGEFLFELHFAAEPAPLHPPLPPTGLGAFVLPSALCDLTGAVPQIAAAFKAQHRGTADEIPAALCHWLHAQHKYLADLTDTATRASLSLSRGGGVCQDFAHAHIALCRALALPARYVSGYAPGEGRMHAWTQVLLGGQWHGFDPTHDRAPHPHSVAVAIGRDFRDANPHEGTFFGPATARLESGCRAVFRE